MSKANTIKEVAKKISDNKDENDYIHVPIGADSDNIDRPNGETVEESLSKLEEKQVTIKPLKFTGASTATYDGSTEETVNIPNYTIFRGATATASGNSGLVPPPTAGVQRKYLRDDGVWEVPDTTSYTVFKGATTSAAGISGLVPSPAAGDITRYLRADATWGTLGAAAFKGVVNNAATTEDGFVPDARVVADLQTQINSLNSALGAIDSIKAVFMNDERYTDADLLPINSCAYVFTAAKNIPTGITNASLIFTGGVSDRKFQLCFGVNNKLYTRVVDAQKVFTNWVER